MVCPVSLAKQNVSRHMQVERPVIPD